VLEKARRKSRRFYCFSCAWRGKYTEGTFQGLARDFPGIYASGGGDFLFQPGVYLHRSCSLSDLSAFSRPPWFCRCTPYRLRKGAINKSCWWHSGPGRGYRPKYAQSMFSRRGNGQYSVLSARKWTLQCGAGPRSADKWTAGECPHDFGTEPEKMEPLIYCAPRQSN